MILRLFYFLIQLMVLIAILPVWASAAGRSMQRVSFPNSAPNSAAASQLQTELKVKKVKPSMKNRWNQGELSQITKSIRCTQFQGTHAGNTVVFQAKGSGGSGLYKHHLIYTLSGFFHGNDPNGRQVHTSRNGNGMFQIVLPDLRDEVPFVQFTVSLITEDRFNPNLSAMSQMNFLVSRQVILSKSTQPEVLKNECFERYLPHESTLGLISNGTSHSSLLQIGHGFQKSLSSTNGWNAGVYLAPLVYLGFGNPIFGNLSYFRHVTKQSLETIQFTSSHEIPPGKFMQLYIQPTRYVRAYDATLVDYCGGTRKVEGAYYFQTWTYSHFLHPVDPTQSMSPSQEQIGAPAMNTCSEALNVLPTGETAGDLEFIPTDI